MTFPNYKCSASLTLLLTLSNQITLFSISNCAVCDSLFRCCFYPLRSLFLSFLYMFNFIILRCVIPVVFDVYIYLTSDSISLFSWGRRIVGDAVTRQWDRRLWNLGSVPDKGSDLSLPHNAQAGFGARRASKPHFCTEVKNAWFCYFAAWCLIPQMYKFVTSCCCMPSVQYSFFLIMLPSSLFHELTIFFCLSRNNQQMSRHSTLFPVNSLHVSLRYCCRTRGCICG
jgi:hypothetical protein